MNYAAIDEDPNANFDQLGGNGTINSRMIYLTPDMLQNKRRIQEIKSMKDAS
jgi:hypothetical protein